MPLQVVQGSTGYVNPSISILSTGWTISGIYGLHESCNSGYIISLTSLGLIVGRQYTITYTVDNYKTGSVNVALGATNGISRTANGTYTETLTCTTTPQMKFFSDGTLRISVLKFFDTQNGYQTGTTISFNESENKWGAEFKYKPDMMIKFIDGFFTVKNGELYEHNTNTNYNTFYGDAYPSKIKFYVNLDAQTIKNYYSIRQQSNLPWGSPNDSDIQIFPHQGKPNGQISRLKAGNYRNLQGDWFADFLRDLNDPRFVTALDALFKGGVLQGHLMEVNLENDDITEVRLVHVDVTTGKQNYTY